MAFNQQEVPILTSWPALGQPQTTAHREQSFSVVVGSPAQDETHYNDGARIFGYKSYDHLFLKICRAYGHQCGSEVLFSSAVKKPRSELTM